MKILYPAKINYSREDHRYTVSFIDLREAITEGETLEEALFNAAEVLTLTLEGRMDEGLKIPLPSVQKKTYLVAPASRVQTALLMRFTKDHRKLSKLTKVLKQSSKLEDPHHWPSLKQLEQAAFAMGQRLVISLEPQNSLSQ